MVVLNVVVALAKVEAKQGFFMETPENLRRITKEFGRKEGVGPKVFGPKLKQ
jgi:hypothetical protein